MSREPSRIKVLCVDDHPIVRQGIATLLAVEPDLDLVGAASNGLEAIQLFRAHQPDVTLMDLQMPGMGGLDAIGAIRAEFPAARIIVLTTYANEHHSQRALQAGACGYLLKNALHKELLDAIRAVHAGRAALPSESSFQLAEEIAEVSLSTSEIRLLRFIAQSDSAKDIASALALSRESVDQQIRSILSKFDEQDRTQVQADELKSGMVNIERSARHAAEAASQAKSRFIAGMSHELRTPLNAILGYAQLLTMEGGLNERQARGVETIYQSGQHLLSLVNDILDLAQIEAGHTELREAPVDLPATLQAVVNILRLKADEKKLSLVLDAAPDLPASVLADERRLRQVLLNLLANAIKFTDQGSVTLRAAFKRTGADRVLLQLAVEDTGIGMLPDDLERIFEPFVQVGSLQRKRGGTGLGLTITRALVADMGGQVQVSSEWGRGTQFRVELPLPLAQPG